MDLLCGLQQLLERFLPGKSGRPPGQGGQAATGTGRSFFRVGSPREPGVGFVQGVRRKCGVSLGLCEWSLMVMGFGEHR